MAGGYSPLNDFISRVKTVGLPTASHYYVLLPDIEQMGKSVQMKCDSAVIPGLNIMTQEIRTAGEASEMPHGVTYQSANLSFLVDNTFDVRKYFETWMNRVYDQQSRTLGYYDEYVSQVTLVVNDKAGGDIFSITLHEAYPKSINDIPVAYSNHEVLHVDVNFVFKYWTREGASYKNAGRGTINPEFVTPAAAQTEDALETLGNVTNAVKTPARAGITDSPTGDLISRGNDINASCRREGKAAQAILTSSGMTAPGDSNFGSNFGSGLANLGKSAAGFGSAMSNLGQSITNVMAPVAAMSSSVASMAGAVGSIDSLLNSVGIKTNLGKIGKDMGGLAGKLGQVSTLKGVPSKMGAVGANMTAVGGTLNTVKKSIENFPNATNQVKNAVGSFGDLFSKQGSAVSEVSSNTQAAVDKGMFGFEP